MIIIRIDPDYFLEVLKETLKNDKSISDEEIGIVLYFVRESLRKSMVEQGGSL